MTVTNTPPGQTASSRLYSSAMGSVLRCFSFLRFFFFSLTSWFGQGGKLFVNIPLESCRDHHSTASILSLRYANLGAERYLVSKSAIISSVGQWTSLTSPERTFALT